ncbi:MAG: outer membrane lipoprotein LolB [Castellaniella sp.]|uniref:outer membrane lipoprotein LolB n=1 Tax=Castellaniella sp. TaxID=1955812 RepID=UPI003C744F28
MIKVRIGRVLSALGLLVLLTACAAPVRIGGQGPAFERIGRFAVNLQPVAQPPYAAQGGFSWRDDGRVLLLDLSNPLGSVLARIRVDAGVSLLERADGSQESASSPDALLAQVWGHPMPVSGLRYWIRGLTEPGQAVSDAQYDAQGRLTAVRQNGWDVRLSAYEDDQGPLRVRLFRQDDQGQWRLQLVMDRS